MRTLKRAMIGVVVLALTVVAFLPLPSSHAFHAGQDHAAEGPNPNFDDPSVPPGEEWEWRGQGPVGSSQGSWYNPSTGEVLHPDINHPPPIGPHYDYKARDGREYRWYRDGHLEPK